MNPARKERLLRISNIITLLIIVFLIYTQRTRIQAMFDPKATELLQTEAPEFVGGHWFNSDPLTLGSLRGKVVVLDFWTFRGRNCLNILPQLKEWTTNLGEDSLVVIGVHTPETLDEADLESLETFLRDEDIRFPVVTDNGYSNWNRYRVQFWPSTFIIDKRGTIRKLHIGELGFGGLEDIVQQLLHE